MRGISRAAGRYMVSEVRNESSPIASAVRRRCLSNPHRSLNRWRSSLGPCREVEGDSPTVAALLKALTLLQERTFWRVLISFRGFSTYGLSDRQAHMVRYRVMIVTHGLATRAPLSLIIFSQHIPDALLQTVEIPLALIPDNRAQ
jgi:hypothetical protein